MSPTIESFYDPATGTVSHLVYDEPGGTAAIVDPVLDFDPAAARTSTASADRIVERIRSLRLSLAWLLETHVHADHLSAAAYLKRSLGGAIGIGSRVGEVQRLFRDVLALGDTFATDGSQFDRLFAPGERFTIGSLEARAIAVPGHTPADVAYAIGDDAVFVGDTLFMPALGSARCDFPGGDARQLYRSVRQLLALPRDTRLYMCHDYPTDGREPAWQTTVGEERSHNIHLNDDIDEERFVAMRTARDATLAVPRLLLPSLQVNLRAGELPPPAANGVSYLQIPLNALPPAGVRR